MDVWMYVCSQHAITGRDMQGKVEAGKSRASRKQEARPRPQVDRPGWSEWVCGHAMGGIAVLSQRPVNVVADCI